MPGMLVHPLDSAMLKSPIDSHASSDSLFRSLPSDLDSHDLSSSRYLAHSALGLSPFRAMDLCCTPPSSPSDIGSPRFLGLDSRDELGQKVFPRSISKLQSLMAVNEEVGLEDGSSNLELLPGCNELTDIGGLSIPLQQSTGSYGSSNSCVNSFGSTNSNSGAMVGSPVLPDAITALQKFLPSNNDDDVVWPLDSWPMDVYSCDDFRMYEFKVRRCMRGRSHDWTECPFAHPGEKARRRDPRRIHYSGAACPDFRKGSCKRGDACEYAHGVFECWLHPARYRTQPCKDGRNCKRRVCFFAHTPEQLRVLPAGSSFSIAASHSSPGRSGLKAPSFTPTYDGSPLRQALASSLDSSLAFDGSYGAGLTNSFLLEDPAAFGSSPRSGNHLHFGFLTGKPGYGVSGYGVSSPTSTLVGHSQSPPPLSPPLSPCVSPPMSPDFSPHSWPNVLASGLVAQASTPLSPLSPALTPAHRLHLDKLQSIPTVSIPVSDSSEMDDLNFSPVATKDAGSPHAMGDLLTTLQNLRLKGRVAEAGKMPSPHWTMQQPAFRHVSRSLPCTPTKSKMACQSGLFGSECGEAGAPEHRVESGRGLRADFYGKIGKENGVENEAPDLGWVNELVK